MADAVIVVDAEGKLLLFNPAAEQIQSFDSTDGKNNEGTEQNEYGLYLPDMVTPYPKDDLPLNRVLHGEAPEENEMFVRVPKAPVGIWLSTIARPLKDENGVLQGGVAVLRDITAGKIAEQELRKSREQLRNLSAHLQSIREQERARMAREIHDQLGQTLTALKMDLSWLVKRLSNGKKALLERTLAMNEIIDMTIQTVQRISAELRPGLLDDLGLSAAVEWQTEQFRERSEIDCTINLSPEHIVVDRECSTEMFRIFQEILTNIARHANATQVKIDLIKREKKLVLKVRDNGEGITKSEISDSQSLGLIGMRERVYPWGGRVRIAGVPDRGTIVCVTMPLQSQRLQFTDLTSV
jgi:signal transduction histidine kinase